MRERWAWAIVVAAIIAVSACAVGPPGDKPEKVRLPASGGYDAS